MFEAAILIGVYSNLIYALGICGFLYKQVIILATLIYLFLIFIFYKKKIIKICFPAGLAIKRVKCYFKSLSKFNLVTFLFILFIIQIIVNLVGVFGPEISFDALWYHLTIPKIFLQSHSIFFIPGSLLYYSAMPKFAEMFYISSIAFQGEILAKLTHFSFGILSCMAIYKLSRKYISQKYAIIAVLIFYSNLVVGWESITAYVDLFWVFFNTMSVWAFLNWWEKANKKWLFISAVMLGFAVAVKLVAITALLLYMLMLVFRTVQLSKKNKLKSIANNASIFLLAILIIPLPWFIFAYVNTGSPVYPFFSLVLHKSFTYHSLNIMNFVKSAFDTFVVSSDPISPIYLIAAPLVVIYFRRLHLFSKILTIYFLLNYIIWYFLPITGGTRFLIAYLPAFSVVIADLIFTLRNQKLLQGFLLFIVILLSMISIVYRALSNYKYLPVILGKQTSDSYLTRHLNFSFGDFYDTDDYFKKNIKESDTVLLYGFHNLYYVNFPFIDSSWVKNGNSFNYIAVQSGKLPKRFNFWELIYFNPQTNVKLYYLGGQKWIY